MALFIVVPLAIVLFYALTDTVDGRLIFTLENFSAAFDPAYVKVFLRSLWMAALATVICLAIGYPLALVLSSRHFKAGKLLLMLVVIPMWMNFLLRTYAWINLLSDNGIIMKALQFFGVENLSLLYNQTAVIVGLVYNFLPFMVLPIYTSLIKIEPNLYEAAGDLGANSFMSFLKVTLPLSVPGIVSGITMTFMPAITSFAVSRLMGGGLVTMYGELIENQFYFMRDWHFGATLSIVMMVLVLISAVLTRNNKNKEGGMLW
ncbi:MAG: ABC transporter permease [Clostridia bacterium]|nr:ABC transporter permease [Clostridia bacterium]